jgi:hypothetical protein
VHQAELILRFTRQLTQSSDSRVVTGYGASPDRVFTYDFENVVVPVHVNPRSQELDADFALTIAQREQSLPSALIVNFSPGCTRLLAAFSAA